MIDVISHVIFCQYHKGVVVDRFCLDCKQALCKRCVTKGHGSHESDDIDVVLTSSKKRLKQLCQTLQAIQGDLEINLNSCRIEKHQDCIDTRTEAISEVYDKFKVKLHELRLMIDSDLEKLNQHSDKQKRELSDYQISVETQMASCEEALVDIDS